MSFPQTRHTLIQRIATGGDANDWKDFLADYWGPVCRFAMRSGQLNFEDAEDVASKTFEALVQNQLLARWISNRSAKLRTLLCSVVRNILSNRFRIEAGRARSLRENADRLDNRAALPVVTSLDAPAEQVDAFYAAWVEELLQQAIEAILDQYHREGKGDYFRVLYGRLCEGMNMSRIAEALSINSTQAESAFKHARKTLAQSLENLVRAHVERYSSEEALEPEFTAEWGQLGEYLKEHGGLEEAVRCAYEVAFSPRQKSRSDSSKHLALKRMSGMFPGLDNNC